MDQPRYWKTLERHPLSAEYPDIDGPLWERFLAGIKEHGIVGKRRVTLYEGKVLDGWQLYRGCVACEIRPEFQPPPKGMTAEQFVEIANDNRRDESQELKELRASKRRERVAVARVEGKSERAIAETEGVSSTTIHKDIEVLTAQGVQCLPLDGKVTGQDGREQPATKPPPEPPKKLCRSCRIGPARPKCKDCKELNKPPREPGDDTESEKESRTRANSNGKPLYDWKPFEQAFGGLMRQIDTLGNACKAKESKEAKALRSNLKDFHKNFKDWHKGLVKAKGAA